LVIPTSSVQSRETELNHVAEWAQENNLKLNRVKLVEIIFRDKRRKQQTPDPLMLPGIQHESPIKILGVTLTKHQSISEHVRDIIGKCGQTVCVLEVLRSHRLNDAVLKDMYRSLVMAKLLNTS